MIQRALLVGCLLFLGYGCGKQTESPARPAGDVSAESVAGGAKPDDAQIAAALNELTQTARRYAAEKRRAPASVEELVGAGYLAAAPQAPAGKKFAINKNLQVYLADQ